VCEEAKDQMGRLWMSFKNEDIWKEKIKLRASKEEEEVMLIQQY